MIDCVFPSPRPDAYPPFAGPGAPYPDQEPQLYPVLAGPPAFYPAERTLAEYCGGCGYARAYHVGGIGCPGLKTKRYEPRSEPEQIDWRDILRRDRAARTAKTTVQPYVPVHVQPPQVPARPPSGPGEFAAYGGRQAVGLGKAARAAGWDVSPWYWVSGDGTEGCAVRLARGPLRGVATWLRAAGCAGGKTGWAADVAYAWRTDAGRMPQKVTHTTLGELIAQ